VQQPLSLDRSRWITKLRLTFSAPDGSKSAEDIALDERSRDEVGKVDPNAGQVLTFPARAFTAVSLEPIDTNVGMVDGRGGLSGIGFSEVRVPGVEVVETVRPPVDLLHQAAASSLDHRLSLLFSRLRSNPTEPVRADEERAMRRLITLPTARTFGLAGQARFSGVADVEKPAGDTANNAVDRLLGLPDHTRGGVTASADVHLPGAPTQRASASIDGDPTTFWSASYLDQDGHYLDYRTPQPLTFDHLDLQVVNDRRHSIPLGLRLTVDGVDKGVLPIPRQQRQDTENGTVTVRVPLPETVTGSNLRFTVEGYDAQFTDDWYADGALVITPVAIAEIGVPGLHLAGPGTEFDSGCRSDLLEIDGKAVPLRVHGSTADALARRPLAVEACDPAGITLSAGDHVLRTGVGADRDLALDIDRLLLSSDRGGTALAHTELPSDVAAAPATSDAQFEHVDGSLKVAGSTSPYWVVLGQSWSTGWKATANGHELGAPVVVNGYGNAWYVDPEVVGPGPVEISITWAPQSLVWAFIGLSVAGGLVCLVLMIRRPRRRREPGEVADDGRPPTPVLRLPPMLARRFRVDDDAGDEGGPWPAEGRRPRRALALTALAVGLFAVLNLPLARTNAVLALASAIGAVAVAAFVVACIRSPRAGGILALAGAGCLALAALHILAFQVIRRYPPDFGWPTNFPAAHVLGLLAVFFLAGEAVRDLIRRTPTET
jgi:arabinofuranan 3-O-arabinosyltransferase